MVYYRVKMSSDGKRCIDKSNNKGYVYELVKHELFTPKEVEKIGIKMDYLEKIEVSRKKTYFFFGARFTME